MSETKTYCIGRFLIDVPKEAEINGQGYEFMFGRINSEKTNADEKEFMVQMEKRKAELAAGKHEKEFKLIETLSPSNDIRIFTLSRTYDLFPDDPPSTGLEAYRLSHGTLFSMAATGFNNKFPQIVDQLRTTVLPAIRTRQPDEIPTEPGFCIENGFIADDGSNNRFEEAQIGFLFKAHPGLLINFVTSKNGDKSEGPLLKRVEEASVKMKLDRSSIRTLRKGIRKAGQFSGEELLDTLPDDNGVKVLHFRWESAGLPNDAYAPNIYVNMSTGMLSEAYTHPTITDAQAIQLFDSIVNSIRLRPAGPAIVSSADPTPLFPLGEAIATGTVCPQSGWWRCNENIQNPYIKIEGGRKQFFQAGHVMPPAVLIGTPTFWQKLFEGKKPFRQPTTILWKLDAYDDATVNSLAAAKSDPHKASEI